MAAAAVTERVAAVFIRGAVVIDPRTPSRTGVRAASLARDVAAACPCSGVARLQLTALTQERQGRKILRVQLVLGQFAHVPYRRLTAEPDAIEH